MRPVIILFAKAPVAGRVKTRLSPPLTPDSAARLHAAFVHDMLERLQAFRGRADVELHTDIPTDAWASTGATQALQHEGDLGLKMFQALHAVLAAGRPWAMIVGSDAPTLPGEHLEALLETDADVTLGPTLDGGYYAIACRRVHPEMFGGVVWSTEETCEQTGAAARTCGLTVGSGPAWRDIDTPADLAWLRATQGPLPRHTAQALEALAREEAMLWTQSEPRP